MNERMVLVSLEKKGEKLNKWRFFERTKEEGQGSVFQLVL